jgi:hypothetical protein
MANSVQNWDRALPGVPCFIIGNGPSLAWYDISLIEKHFSIGINRAFYKIDPTILLWQDLQLWHTDKHNLLKTIAIKYCRDRADIQGRFYHFKLSIGDYSLPESASVLHGRGSSGPLAFQLAYILGCNPIVLLGCDCCYRDNKTNFYGINPMHKPHTLRNCRKGLRWIRDSKCGRDVINCSDNKEFDNTQDLRDVVRTIGSSGPHDREFWTQKILHHNK